MDGCSAAHPKNMSCRHSCPSCERSYLSTISGAILMAATSVSRVKVLYSNGDKENISNYVASVLQRLVHRYNLIVSFT